MKESNKHTHPHQKTTLTYTSYLHVITTLLRVHSVADIECYLSSVCYLCVVNRTDNYSYVGGLQLDRPPMLGPVSVKSVIVLPSRAAAGVVQFASADNITGLSVTQTLCHVTLYPI